MFVLLDLEWIDLDAGERYLTQLSAIRTDEEWNVIKRFDILARPPAKCIDMPDHMAFGGLDIQLYKQSGREVKAFLAFLNWLKPDDVIVVWARSNKRYVQTLWEKVLDVAAPGVISMARAVRLSLSPDDPTFATPYEILESLSIPAPGKEHHAASDVEAMRLVLHAMKVSPLEAPVNDRPERPSQRELNKQAIRNSSYNYIYLNGSPVFHTRECKIPLRAKAASDIFGSIYYKTAARKRRPCKLCNPQIILADELAEKNKAEAAAIEERNREVKRTKMVSGDTIQIKRGKVVGWCHYHLHPGALNAALLKEHDCLKKTCYHLEKNTESPFWANLEAEEQARKERKSQIQAEREARRLEEDEVQTLADEWQDYLDNIESDMYIVRVAKESKRFYTVFYVSDNRFADGNLFPEFIGHVNTNYPNSRIRLRHIRDVDGHFVTADEYFSRRRK